MLHILPVLMGSDGCLVASAVFKTVEGSYAALVGSIPSLSAFSISGFLLVNKE